MFGGRLTLFELFGFKVRVDPSWLLLAALIVWSLAAGYFPATQPGWRPRVYWIMGGAGLLGLAASVVVHELAHSLVARRFDMPITGITLFVFGGIAEMNEEPPTARGEFLMAIAGPVVSLVIAGLLWGLVVLALHLGGDPSNPALAVVSYLSFLNLLLAGFNMVPAFPLDGGRCLRAALWAWRGDLLLATRMATGAGSLVGLAVAGWGVYALVLGSVVGGLWWIMVGMFIRTAAGQAYRQAAGRRLLAGQPVTRLMNSSPVAVEPGVTIERLVEDYFYRHGFKSFPVVAGGRLVGCVAIDAVKSVPRPEWRSRTVAEVMEGCIGATIPDHVDAAQALARMRRSGRSRVLVTRDGRLVGVLSLRDLLDHLTVREDLEGGHAS
ncbi:MAG: site-2 protease family protein [Actinomycetota bacterium]